MVGCGNHSSTDENIVSVGLRFLNIEEYTETFIDNGYDYLKTVKLMGEEDLKAIGIDNQKDKEIILYSVKILRVQGAAWVYLLLGDEEDGAGTSSSGKMSTSEDEGFSYSSSGKESSSMRMKRERNYKYIENKSKTLIFVNFFLKFYFQN